MGVGGRACYVFISASSGKNINWTPAVLHAAGRSGLPAAGEGLGLRRVNFGHDPVAKFNALCPQRGSKELKPLVMKPELPTDQKSQEDKSKENPASSHASAAQMSRACFRKFLSYFAGDMAPFAKWMKST